MLKHFLILAFSYLHAVNCIIPGLSVRKVDSKVIEKKRQDTLEICRLFNEENDRLRNNYENGGNNDSNQTIRRSKREVDSNTLGNPVLKKEDILRVEKIVDKLYDDIDQKANRLTNKQKDFQQTSKSNATKVNNKQQRRFNFAPAQLFGPRTLKVADLKFTVNKSVKYPWIKQWKHGIVPFFIDSNSYDSHLADIMLKAFDYIEKVSCIRLQRLREKPTDELSMKKVEWLYITNPSGIRQCVHSNEKKKNTGVQMVVLGYDCLSQGEIAHEIMHVLGFSHEHTRSDRDRYITIQWDNIKPGYKKYFQVRADDDLMHLFPYDYASVLHYPARAFSRNGQMTVMTESGMKIGQREVLSEIDIQKIGFVYGQECLDRNKDYLMKTCPSVGKTIIANPPTPDDIKNYFKDRIWPYGIINYKLKDKIEFTAEEKENIKAVFNHIEKETCIEFRDITEEEDNKDINSGETTEAEPDVDKTGNNIKSDKVPKEKSDDEKKEDNNIEADENTTVESNNNEEDKHSKSDETARPSPNEDDFVKGINLTESTTESGKLKMTLKVIPRTTLHNIDIHNENYVVSDENDLRRGKNIKKIRAIRKLHKKLVKGHTILPKSPARRHAANIMILSRSSKPGCKCPSPGRPNGNKELPIDAGCFNSVNDLLHFMVHVLGLEHQHNMHDRDSFLHIVWNKLSQEIKDEMKDTLPPAASAGFAYDYQSVMHYPWLQIKHGVSNIMYPIWNDGWAMGHWQGLSWTDVQKLNILYFDECEKRKNHTRQS